MDIVLYSTDCPRCKVLKKKLSNVGIKYIENNSVEEITRLGFTEVPILKVDDKFMDFLEANLWIGSVKVNKSNEVNE